MTTFDQLILLCQFPPILPIGKYCHDMAITSGLAFSSTIYFLWGSFCEMSKKKPCSCSSTNRRSHVVLPNNGGTMQHAKTCSLPRHKPSGDDAQPISTDMKELGKRFSMSYSHIRGRSPSRNITSMEHSG